MKNRNLISWTNLSLILILFSCSKPSSQNNLVVIPATVFNVTSLKVNGTNNGFNYTNVNFNPLIRISCSDIINRSSVSGNIIVRDANGNNVAVSPSYDNNDSTLIIQPSLSSVTKYKLTINTGLQSKSGSSLRSVIDADLFTSIDSSRKFPIISDDSLLTLVQKQTFKYFWDNGHPVSGLARERNSSGDIVTSGGSGFGIMTIPVAVNRGFISRVQGITRMQTIIAFLKNTAQKFHGAFPHWINGSTGVVVPFSANDNGADLVETSYLMQGLLTARQYFNGSDPAETTLRNDINILWNGVEWSWFRQSGQNTLYWHWSPDKAWIMNMPIKGWNECLITYILASSSASNGIPKSVYDNGWTNNSGFVNGNSYYGYQLPLGPSVGGPLFFSQYSFLGVNPNGLTDAFANYATQTKNHTLINYTYCKTNPLNNFGYSDSCWGLTASDIQNGYTASSPTNDVGVIAPTAAISSFPYTPVESMKALKFFYYVLGDKIWKDNGFVDAFSLKDTWYANSYLAIDQVPEIIMIENYRTGLLWNLFTSCPEVKSGMKSLGFTAPYL